MLCSQFGAICAELAVQVNEKLAVQELSSLISFEDVNAVFAVYDRIFRKYVDDPLWPTFKFPFTANEQARLTSTLTLRLADLQSVFSEMSLKVKYGGVSAALKDATVRHIHLIVQELLPEAAFLRRPSYPGVSCRFRNQFGFTAIISRPLYSEGNRPREVFRAMKYFHLGHRLEDIVERERELARKAREQELKQ